MSVRAMAMGQRRMMLLIVAVGAAFILFFPARQMVQQSSHIGDLEHRLVELRTENHNLSKQVKKLNDPGELERLARERLGLVRPGEQAYFVDPVKANGKPAPVKPGKASSWERAWDWLASLIRGRD